MKKIVLIVGIGGTGGNFAKEFCRYVSYLPEEERNDINIVFVDGDIVEEKNLKRQPFFEDDISRPKAAAFADTIADSFELDVCVADKYLSDQQEIVDIVQSLAPEHESYIPIIVGCVDNHRARQVMHDYFCSAATKNCIYFDSGNEFESGEIITGVKAQGEIKQQPRGYYFPEVLTDTSPSKLEESCGAINESSPQHLVTNLMASNLLLSEVVNFLDSGATKDGILFFNAFEPYVVRRVPERMGEK